MSLSDLEPCTDAATSAWAAWRAGCSTIPVRDDGSKKPPIAWEEYQHRRPTEDEMRAWFSGPNAARAAAVICGQVSGGLVMLEMEGPDYEAGRWRAFRDAAVAALGEERWRQITGCIEMSPSGGPHLLIRCTETTIGNLKLARRRTGPKTVEVIMETRGEGGYTVIAGSVGHSSGNAWSMAQGSYDEIATVTADELHAILDAARSLDEMPAPTISLPNAATTERPRVAGDSVFDEVVDDFNRRTTWAQVLAGVFEYAFQRGQVTYWHRIGSDNEVGATTNATGRDTLIVFSSSTLFGCYDGTGPAPSYDRFSATAVLCHDGDRTEAYRALREDGYGPGPREPERNPFEPDWGALGGPEAHEEPAAGAEAPQDDEEVEPSSWAPIDLTAALEGVDVDPPAWWRRTDNVPLIYAGRTHWFQGPSESLKSMAAQMLVAEALAAGARVLYLDFEDDDRGVVARLLAMAVEPERIGTLLTYVRPDEPLQDRKGAWTPGGLDYLRLLTERFEVVVLDGVTEAMTTEGMDLLDNGDTARWMRLLPKRLADTGAAVVVIDHTTKNAESAGRHAIGAQHKLAGVTGATYKFEVLRPLARAVIEEVTGQVKITVTKDRPGWVRGRCAEGVVGMLEVTSYPDGGLSVSVAAPGAESQAVDMELVGEILRHLMTYEGATGRHIEDAMSAKGARVRGAIKASIGRGWVQVRRVGASHQHYITEAGREVMK